MKMKSLVTATFALLLLVCASKAQTGAPAAWTPELQIKVRAVGTPRVSPDGRRVVYTVSDAVMTPERSEYVSQIWMATADGKENVQLTFADKSSTNPKWSPDGNWLAFTSARKENRNNLYLLRVGGGEAEPLTDLKGSVADFDWSPDGRFIAYTTDRKSVV
jgi:Tol biopolymer transport system component